MRFLTLSLIVGRNWTRINRKATTGRRQRRDVRNIVSHTLGWFREFLAVPAVQQEIQWKGLIPYSNIHDLKGLYSYSRDEVPKFFYTQPINLYISGRIAWLKNEDVAFINELRRLTNKGENWSEDEEHAIAVHGECHSKISCQAAPYKELVYCCPIMGVQTQLQIAF